MSNAIISQASIDFLATQAKWFGNKLPDCHSSNTEHRTAVCGHMVATNKEGGYSLFPLFNGGRFSINEFRPDAGGIQTESRGLFNHPETAGDVVAMVTAYLSDAEAGHHLRAAPKAIGVMTCQGEFTALV
jgi:hypothetical protein